MAITILNNVSRVERAESELLLKNSPRIANFTIWSQLIASVLPSELDLASSSAALQTLVSRQMLYSFI